MKRPLPPRRFTPVLNQPYWSVVGREVRCFVWKGDFGDRHNLATYNCFRSKREALNRINPEAVQEEAS